MPYVFCLHCDKSWGQQTCLFTSSWRSKALGNIRKLKWSQKGELSVVFCPHFTYSAFLSLGQRGLGSASPQRQRFKCWEEGIDFFFHVNWKKTYLLKDFCEGNGISMAPSTLQIRWIPVRLVVKQYQKQESGIKICSHCSNQFEQWGSKLRFM